MDLRIEKMAQVLVNFSTEVQPSDHVLIRAMSPLAEPLVQAIYQETLRVGAHPFPYIHFHNETSLTLEATQEPELLSKVNPMLEMMYRDCDVVFRIEASENPLALTDYPTDAQAALSIQKRTLVGIQVERSGVGELRWCTTAFPTQGYAQQAGMSLAQYETFFYNACKLHLDDPVAAWKAFAQRQQRLVDYLADKKQLHIQANHIDLTMSIDGHTFINASGSYNFPDGEIFTGPVEDSVNGWVKFDYPAHYLGNEVDGVELVFKDGLITEAKAEKNEQFLLSILDTDSGSRRLGEFAIGNNYDIQRATGSVLFDEKIGGTIHMAIGSGYPETGNTNQSLVHWDMVCGLQNGGQIKADGELFYENGQFLVE